MDDWWCWGRIVSTIWMSISIIGIRVHIMCTSVGVMDTSVYVSKTSAGNKGKNSDAIVMNLGIAERSVRK